MRTNIEINDQIMDEAIRLSNLKTKKEVVETALKSFIEKLKRQNMLKLKGNVNWEGNLDEMRMA
jgi:Arc/MetJ family transcription regulator